MAATQPHAGGGIDVESLDMGLPIANAENKKLEAEVQGKEKEITSLQRQAEQLGDRVQAMGDHLKNVRQELHHTQGLYEARKKDVETEHHMRQVAEREDGRLKDELKRLESERSDLKEKLNVYENTVFKTNQKIEDMKVKMNWDQQALETWLEESAHRDDDAMILAKYARVDEDKVKQMTLKLEQLQEMSVRKRRLLDAETTETLTAQIELDKTATSFRQAHTDREELINQWEQTIDQMRRRDADMDKCASELAVLKAEIRSKNDAIKEKQEFLDDEKRNNSEKEKKVDILEREAAKVRLAHQDSEAARIAFRDELETLKYSVDRTAGDLEKTRTESSHLSHQIKDNRRKLDTLVHQRELMQHELKKSTQKMLSAEERAQEMDQLLAEEEERVAQLEKELRKTREKQFKLAQEVFELKGKETNMAADIQGGRATLRNLGSKQSKKDEDVLKQQEILYTQDFQLQQLQHKLNRLEGERTDDEKVALNARIKELEGEWEWQQGQEQMLATQLKRLQDDLRRINHQLERGKKEKLALEERIDEINLHIETTQRELKKVVTSKQDHMVEENIVKLEVKRLRDALFSHAGEVHSLERRQLELHTAMMERNKEIALHKDMLKAQSKSMESERQAISLEVHERISKIDKMRKRYEIITVAMAPKEGEEEHSQAYYVIKAAQEREELQRKGDEYDSKIRKAEKEIRALENTLQIMSGRNEKYRKSLTKVDHSSEEVGQLEVLEGQWRAALDKCRHKKKQVRQLEGDLQTMQKTLTTLKSDRATLEVRLEAKQAKMAATEKELSDLKAKKDRLHRQTTKVSRELRAKQGTAAASDLEEDIDLCELRDFGQTMVQQVGNLATKQPDLTPTLQLLFSQAGLPPPPSPASSRASSALSSARSSASQLSSRSSSSRSSATPSIPLKTKAIELGMELPLSGSSTPKAGSLAGSRAGSQASSRHSSRPPSQTSSRSSSQASSRASSRGRVDLTIRPS